MAIQTNNLRRFPPNSVRQAQLERLLELRILHRRQMFEVRLRLRQMAAILPTPTFAARLAANAQAAFDKLDIYCNELDNLIRSEREYWAHVAQCTHDEQLQRRAG